MAALSLVLVPGTLVMGYIRMMSVSSDPPPFLAVRSQRPALPARPLPVPNAITLDFVVDCAE